MTSAIYALEILSDKRAIQSLVEVAQNDDSFGVRRSATVVLGEVGDITTIPSLEKLERDSPYKTVQKAAKQAIETIRHRTQGHPKAPPITAPK